MHLQKAADQNTIVRFFYVHCFSHVWNRLKPTENPSFTPPRFTLFQNIIENSKLSFFFNILNNYKVQVLFGCLLTIIYACLNLTVPQLIKIFMKFMHQKHQENKQQKSAIQFLQALVLIQLLRILFRQHSRRIFFELALKVQSSLARKLVQKSLKMSRKTRNELPRSEIIQLENVDLRLVFTLFKNMHIIFQAPFTIIVAIIMLFYQSKAYGFIGIYWFILIFLINRDLDGKMTHCNEAKLQLIQKRSKSNYQMMQYFSQAKLIGWEDILIQKNNDYLEQQNADHKKFYRYASLYDISILLLPVLVVVSICAYDINNPNPITVQQVYLMLSLLNICYGPMKTFKIIRISYHDGIHSLLRIHKYFSLPQDHSQNFIIDSHLPVGTIIIRSNTIIKYKQSIQNCNFYFDCHVEAHPGDRLIFIGRQNQGQKTVVELFTGGVSLIVGKIHINGTIAYVPQTDFFTKQSIRENIIFMDNSISQQTIINITNRLKITNLDKIVGQDTSLTKTQKTKISLARALCRKADIYILEHLESDLDEQINQELDKILKEKQRQGSLVIIFPSIIRNIQNHHKVAIIEKGALVQFGAYLSLLANPISIIGNFITTKQEKEDEEKKYFKNSVIKKEKEKTHAQIERQINFNNLLIMMSSTVRIQWVYPQPQFKDKSKISFFSHLWKFLSCISFFEFLLILSVVACAQLLHVFIHYFIGHLQEDHGQSKYMNYANMVLVEVVLTIGLSLILYYEGQISSMIAVIQGNTLYKDSLTSLCKKSIKWFTKVYSTRIADLFNHDYQEVFIAYHGFLTIYKNLIILIVTIQFISSDRYSIFIAFVLISIIYFSLFWVFLKVQSNVIKHHYDYKYKYVKVLEQSVQGCQIFKVYKKEHELMKRAQHEYKKLASYKLAQSYTSYALNISCDIISLILLGGFVAYGLQMKMSSNRTNLALIATSIHLLLNSTNVLKDLVRQTINFCSFFSLNLIPFMEIADKNQIQQNKINPNNQNWDLQFDQLILSQSKQFQNPLSFNIEQGQKVLILQINDHARNLLLLALTNSLPTAPFTKLKKNRNTIRIGDIDIRKFNLEYLKSNIGVITKKNFYISGKLKDNLLRKQKLNQNFATQYIKLLKLDRDLQDFSAYGLDTQIQFEAGKVNHQVTKKLAVLRILLHKPKIVIIADTSQYIGSQSITKIIGDHIPKCTIIKLSGIIQAAANVNRIIYMKDHVILEDNNPETLMKMKNSALGKLLRESNLEGYVYMQKVSTNLKKAQTLL